MGDVIDLRDRRGTALLVHPSARFTAGPAGTVAHRRDPASVTAACGAPGVLTVAPPAVPLCTACYPAPIIGQRDAR